MDLQQSVHQLLKEVGPGQQITRSAYDTAWIARLNGMDEQMSDRALAWLREHQLADGSWGAKAPTYYHDRLICTLAAMIALAKRGQSRDLMRWRRAELALDRTSKGLLADPAGNTVGFEMIVPTLLNEAKALGIIHQQRDDVLNWLTRHRAAKLAALPDGMINRFVTVAFSAEMVGSDGLHLLDLENLQEANGSVSYSPAATAFFALQVRPNDEAALNYLREVTFDSAVPYVAPIDVFERAWALWNLAITGAVDSRLSAVCQPHLDFLEAEWCPGKGIASVAGLTCRDGDATSLVYHVLAHYGRAVDLGGVLHYEEDDLFRCYALEANPSISTNVHVLAALRQAGLDVEHPSVTKVIRFLFRAQTLQLFWLDKWHSSPYYPTAHAVVACAGYADWLTDDAVYWILETQNADGSWGYYGPTAEETSYCLQALVTWKRHGNSVPNDVLKRGVAWLVEHTEPPYPPLWIGKCLYCPILVVRSAILSALVLVDAEGLTCE